MGGATRGAAAAVAALAFELGTNGSAETPSRPRPACCSICRRETAGAEVDEAFFTRSSLGLEFMHAPRNRARGSSVALHPGRSEAAAHAEGDGDEVHRRAV